jgi:hypothetical protein
VIPADHQQVIGTAETDKCLQQNGQILFAGEASGIDQHTRIG